VCELDREIVGVDHRQYTLGVNYISVVTKYPNNHAQPSILLLETPLPPAQTWQHWHPLYGHCMKYYSEELNG
jgi:hypothetical protein